MGSVNTAPGGGYQFKDLVAGSYTVAASLPGFSITPSATTVELKGDTAGIDFIASCIEGHLITGKVLSAGGAPLSGISVLSTDAGSLYAQTDVNGDFVSECLPGGTYSFAPLIAAGLVSSPPSRTVTLAAADIGSQDFSIANLRSLSGTVTADGAPLAGVTFAVTGSVIAPQATGTDGRFTFGAAEGNSVTMIPSTVCPSYQFTPSSRSVLIGTEDLTALDFSAGYIAGLYTIGGSVTGPSGPLPGVAVLLSGGMTASTVTGSDGSYGFSGLRNGSYSVSVSSPIYALPDGKSVSLCNGDASGTDFHATLTWAKDYGGYVKLVERTADGGFIAAGYSGNTADVVLLRLTPSGNILWQKKFGGGTPDEPNTLLATDDGGCIVAGYSYSYGAGNADGWIVKLDGTGAIQWQKAYGGATHDEIKSLRKTGDGGYLAAGTTTSFGSDISGWIMKLDGAGNILWQKIYGSGSWLMDITVTSDGGAFAGGYTRSGLWLLRINASGDVQWQKTFSGGLARAVATTVDGGFVVAGAYYAYGSTSYDYLVMRVDVAGNLLWQETFPAPGDQLADAVISTADGGFLVAGDYLLKLSGMGEILWQKQYGGASIRELPDGGYVTARRSVSRLDATGSLTDCGIMGNPGVAANPAPLQLVGSTGTVSNIDAAVTQSTAVAVDAGLTALTVCPPP
jgi:hypothetical protein